MVVWKHSAACVTECIYLEVLVSMLTSNLKSKDGKVRVIGLSDLEHIG